MKICTDCQHLIMGRFCSAPSNGIDPVSGGPKHQSAGVHRSADTTVLYPGQLLCGVEGRYFTAKITHKKVRWLFGLLK